MIKIIITATSILISTQALSETSSYQLRHKICRNLADSVGEKLDRMTGTTMQRADAIDLMGQNISNQKSRELYLDVARQYEYQHTSYRKWSDAYEYCIEHINDSSYN